MRYTHGIALILGLFSSAGALYAAEPAGLDAGLVNPGYHEKPSWFKESFLDIREDINEAKQNNKRLLLYFYQDGCPYCAKLLQDNFGQKQIADKTRKHFDTIAINMWGDREVTDLDGSVTTEKNFAAKLRVMFTPTLVFFNEQGQVALRINGYYAPDKFSAALDYVAQHRESKQRFADFYQQLAPQKASGKLHSEAFILPPPYDLQVLSKQGKPLLILFEQRQCHVCDELHSDIFKRKETLTELAKFNVVRLDMWDAKTPLTDLQGKKTNAKALAKALQVQTVPSMVMFGRDGKEAFRTEAYLKAFHLQSSMDYVSSGAYKTQPSFQRYIAARADKIEAQGVHIDLWK